HSLLPRMQPACQIAKGTGPPSGKPAPHIKASPRGRVYGWTRTHVKNHEEQGFRNHHSGSCGSLFGTPHPEAAVGATSAGRRCRIATSPQRTLTGDGPPGHGGYGWIRRTRRTRAGTKKGIRHHGCPGLAPEGNR